MAQSKTAEAKSKPKSAGAEKAPKLPPPDECRELLTKMATIRRFEEEAGRQYQKAKAGGFLHLAIGEEAT